MVLRNVMIKAVLMCMGSAAVHEPCVRGLRKSFENILLTKFKLTVIELYSETGGLRLL